MLFQIDLTAAVPEEVQQSYWAGREAPDPQRAFADRLVAGVRAVLADLDRRISGAAENWRLERMPVVDRNVLRIAVWELLHERSTPPAVVIDEAVEIARRYSSAASAAFVNGVLDAVRRGLELERGPDAEPSAGEDGELKCAAP
jgi:N utilization substance protein B